MKSFVAIAGVAGVALSAPLRQCPPSEWFCNEPVHPDEIYVDYEDAGTTAEPSPVYSVYSPDEVFSSTIEATSSASPSSVEESSPVELSSTLITEPSFVKPSTTLITEPASEAGSPHFTAPTTLYQTETLTFKYWQDGELNTVTTTVVDSVVIEQPVDTNLPAIFTEYVTSTEWLADWPTATAR